jgi:hypothetical protein
LPPIADPEAVVRDVLDRVAGFGPLQRYLDDPEVEEIWVYEGETLGFRTLHVYLPRSGPIMAMGLNSQPADDQIGALVLAVYKTLVSRGSSHPQRHMLSRDEGTTTPRDAPRSVDHGWPRKSCCRCLCSVGASHVGGGMIRRMVRSGWAGSCGPAS